jgi:hypothetical protein
MISVIENGWNQYFGTILMIDMQQLFGGMFFPQRKLG